MNKLINLALLGLSCLSITTGYSMDNNSEQASSITPVQIDMEAYQKPTN